jgi:hypothetical protein
VVQFSTQNQSKVCPVLGAFQFSVPQISAEQIRVFLFEREGATRDEVLQVFQISRAAFVCFGI